MKLNTLKANGFKYKHWCGPTALAIITGRTLKYCHNKLAAIRGQSPARLRGVWNSNMRIALDHMGFVAIRVCPKQRKTLRHFIEEEQTTDQFRSVMLVNVTKHYVVIQRGMVVDNHCSTPMPVREHPMWRKRIDHMWVVKRKKK